MLTALRVAGRRFELAPARELRRAPGARAAEMPGR